MSKAIHLVYGMVLAVVILTGTRLGVRHLPMDFQHEWAAAEDLVRDMALSRGR